MSEQFHVGNLVTDDHEGAPVYWDQDGGMFWCDHCGKYIAFTKDEEANEIE